MQVNPTPPPGTSKEGGETVWEWRWEAKRKSLSLIFSLWDTKTVWIGYSLHLREVEEEELSQEEPGFRWIQERKATFIREDACMRICWLQTWRAQWNMDIGVEDHVRFMGEMFWTMCVTMRVHFQFSQDCPSLYLSPNMQFSTCAGSDNESCDLLNRKGWLKKSVLLAMAERKDVHCGITCSGCM